MEGPYYTCSVCNRLLYRKSVIQLKEAKYNTRFLFTNKKSFDNNEYICKTCDLKVSKGKVPCQAVYNKLLVDEIPTELESPCSTAHCIRENSSNAQRPTTKN